MSEFTRLRHLDGVHPYHIPEKGSYGARKGCHDEICAWEHFGGLTLEEAYTKFCERPDIYQEDFMFMRGPVFEYYYPVIETYLHEVHVTDCFDDAEAWILARIIGNQWENPKLRGSKDLCLRVMALCQHVKLHLGQYAQQPHRQKKICEAWTELEGIIQTKG